MSRTNTTCRTVPGYATTRPIGRCHPPPYSNLVYSDDLPEQPHHRLSAIWSSGNRNYKYQLYHTYRSNVWNINTSIVDEIVDRLLLERLKATTIDESVWQSALSSVDHGNHAEVRRLEAAIRQAEVAKANIINSLTTLSLTEMVERAEERYRALLLELESMKAERSRLKSSEGRHISLTAARPVLDLVIATWHDVPRQERRSLFEAFATYIHITKITRHTKHVVVHWRDGSTSSDHTTHRSRGYFWEEEDLQKLATMIADNVDQVAILREFPDHQWRALRQRISYHYGKDLWAAYAGVKKYHNSICWADTVEARAEQDAGAQTAIGAVSSSEATQLTTNKGLTDRSRSAFCCVCGRSWPPRSESPAAPDGASAGTPHPPR